MTQKTMLLDVFKGNLAAVELIQHIGGVSQLWDDLIDKDNPIDDDTINAAFITLFSDLQRNSFYNEWKAELLPIIEMAIIDWMTANKYEAMSQQPAMSYVLRSNLAALIITIAKIIGGMNWAIRCSVKIRNQIYSDSFEEYIKCA